MLCRKPLILNPSRHKDFSVLLWTEKKTISLFCFICPSLPQKMDFPTSVSTLTQQNNVTKCSLFDSKVESSGRSDSEAQEPEASTIYWYWYIYWYVSYVVLIPTVPEPGVRSHIQFSVPAVDISWKLFFKHSAVHAEAYCPWRCYFPQITAK